VKLANAASIFSPAVAKSSAWAPPYQTPPPLRSFLFSHRTLVFPTFDPIKPSCRLSFSSSLGSTLLGAWRQPNHYCRLRPSSDNDSFCSVSQCLGVGGRIVGELEGKKKRKSICFASRFNHRHTIVCVWGMVAEETESEEGRERAVF
jgi:hypothetical protein